jgi:N-acetylglutamate synthase-like GNAT family acetyltransferase
VTAETLVEAPYVSRLLPEWEWSKLAGTEAESIYQALDPRTAKVLAVERDGQIVGCWILAPVYHAECLWMHPEHRGKTSVARRLWGLMRSTCRQLGIRTVATAADSDTVRDLLAHVQAIKVPADTYVMTFKEP